ncbi:MAG: hypothetical protein LBQ70_02120 [Prevotellaceae bacterium]|jgi:hypothetical protein|nr:hypothetical protein [Prevotellaceae bacterium]
MKQIIFILKRSTNRRILILCVGAFAFTSCYDAEPLPNRVQSDYEFAIPVIDTTVQMGDFMELAVIGVIHDTMTISEGTPISMGELSYPFYIGDYATSQEIKWLEPQMIVDTKDFPSGTVADIKIYTKDDNEKAYYFWLPEDYSITLTATQLKVPDTPNRITDISRFRTARQVFMNISIKYPTAVSVSKIVHDKVNIKFAIKFGIKTDLTINL